MPTTVGFGGPARNELVPEERVELSRCCHHQILSLARIPISPLRHEPHDYIKRNLVKIGDEK